MATPASSPAHFAVTLTSPDIVIPGTFATKSGGNATADARRYRPGGSPVEEVTGGPPTRDDLTVGREWRRDRDAALYRWFDANVGSARLTVTVQPLDDGYNAFGQPMVYADALLIGVNAPDVDSDGGTDTAQLELTFAVSGSVA